MESKNRDYVLNLLEEMVRFKHKIEIKNEFSSISTANRFIVVQKQNYVFIKDFESSFVLRLNENNTKDIIRKIGEKKLLKQL